MENQSHVEMQFDEVKLTPDTTPDVLDLYGTIPTVSAVPTWTPRKFYEQFVIYKNGATIRFYIYDMVNNAWHYTALT